MKNRHVGFTLIETMIVLAIAGLILTLVFLAIGGTQRAQRDKASRQAAADTIVQYEAYLTDHADQPPKINPQTANELAPYMTKIQDGQGRSPEFFHLSVASGVRDYATPDRSLIYSIGAICSTRGADQSINENPLPVAQGGNGGVDKAFIAVAYYSESAKKSICLQNK